MYSLYSSLKPFYAKFLIRGSSYGQSPDVVHENALNLFIKILGLFLIKEATNITSSQLNNSRQVRMEIHEVIFQPEKQIFLLFPKGIPLILKDILKLSHLEYQLKDSLNKQEWEEFIAILMEYKWTSEEYFDEEKNKQTEISPGFLSYFYENVQNEFENFFSLKPKVSKRKNKGIFYTGWDIIRKITDECFNQYESQNLLETFENHLSIKLLDPSCGTGSFLVYAAESLYQRQKKLISANNTLPNSIIERCIYGIDLAPSCLNVVKFRLLCWILSKGSVDINSLHSWMFMNINSGNSLFGLCKEKVQYPLDYYAVLSRIMNYIQSNTDDRIKTSSESNKNWLFTSIQIKEARKGLFHSDTLQKTISEAHDELYRLVDTFYRNITVNELKNYPKSAPLRIKDLANFSLFHWGIAFPEVILKGGFDVIIGNPPYGRSILSSMEKNLVKLMYQSCSGSNAKKYSLNAVSAFIERSINLLKSNGVIGLIVPFSILRVEEFENLRCLILEKTVILRIDDESAAFTEVTLEMCSLFLLKQKKENYEINITPRSKIKVHSAISVNIFKKYKRFMIYYDDFWIKAEKQGKQDIVKGDYGIDHRIVKKDLTQEFSSKYCIIFLHSGKSVGKYALNPKYFHWSKPHPNNERFNKYFKEKRIITTAIGNYFRVAIKPERVIPGTNVSILEVPPSYSLLPMLIILNSDLINYLLKRYILNFSHLTVYLHKYYTKIIPIKYPSENEKVFEILASYLVFLNQCELSNYLNHDKRIEYLDNLANYLVYDLYFPDISDNTQHFASIVGKYLIPIEIDPLLDLIYEKKQTIDSDTEVLARLISSNKKIIHNVTNKLREDERIRNYKKEIFSSQIVKHIRIGK